MAAALLCLSPEAGVSLVRRTSLLYVGRPPLDNVRGPVFLVRELPGVPRGSVGSDPEYARGERRNHFPSTTSLQNRKRHSQFAGRCALDSADFLLCAVEL